MHRPSKTSTRELGCRGHGRGAAWDTTGRAWHRHWLSGPGMTGSPSHPQSACPARRRHNPSEPLDSGEQRRAGLPFRAAHWPGQLRQFAPPSTVNPGEECLLQRRHGP